MRKNTILAAILAVILAATMSITATAAQNPFAHMEAQSRQAVESAIKAGTVPKGTTIYDCMYGADKNGVTIVIQYKDKNGNWIDITTQEKKPEKTQPSGNAANAQKVLTADEQKAYTDKVFELVNKEREKAGQTPLERSEYLDEAANTRALECASVNSLYVNGIAHTRPDGSRWFTVLGISKNYNYGENGGQGKATADMQMKSWMKSDGHRANILNDDYTEIGIGCAVSEQGEVFAVQIFYRP